MVLKKLSFSHRIFMLVAFFIGIELAILGAFSWLNTEAESLVLNEKHTTKTVLLIEKLKQQRIDAWKKVLKFSWYGDVNMVHDYGESISEVKETVYQLQRHLSESDNSLEARKSLFLVEMKLNELISLTETVSEEIMIGSVNSYPRKKLKVIKLNELMDSEIDRITNQQYKQALNDSMNLASTIRLFWHLMIFGFIASLAFIALFAAFIIKDLKYGIKQIAKNAVNMVNGNERHNLVHPFEELNLLDRIHEKVARAVEEANGKNQSLIDNASQVICSINSSLTFQSVSLVSEKSWGYSGDDLCGLRFLNIVHEKDHAQTYEAFEKARATGESVVFDSRILKKDGSQIELCWSIQWCQNEESYFCVTQDVTDEREAQRDRQKMLEIVGHDLKLPLTTVQQSLEIIEDVENLQPVSSRTIDRALVSTAEMLRLINDLLDAEKVKAGKLSLAKSTIDLDKVIDNAVSQVTHYATTRDVEVLYSSSSLRLEADSQRLTQVVVNLLTNAIKYSKAGSKVKVVSKQKGNSVEVAVIDQGRGISEKNLEKVFSRYEQNESSDSKNGTGLGLYICKSLVELHGGTIQVESKYGKGSIFTVVLPVKVNVSEPLSVSDVNNRFASLQIV